MSSVGFARVLNGVGGGDLQRFWDHGTITPLERPADYGDRRLLTDEEVAALNLANGVVTFSLP
jgi:hypothetical protein